MPAPERRGDDERASDHIYQLLETIREAQAHGMEQLGDAIAMVQNRLEAISAKSNDAALENVRVITKLEGRVEAAEKRADALAVQIGEVRAEGRETKADVKPLQFAYAKLAALAGAVASAAALIFQALDLFNRHTGK